MATLFLSTLLTIQEITTFQNANFGSKGIPILTKGLGHEKNMLHLTKMTFLIKYQAENLVKYPSKWSWLNQIGHIEQIGFSEIDHPYLTLNQIDHYNFTHNQMSCIHLMT